MSKITAIPEITNDPQSMTNALMAIKQILEGLTGQRPGSLASVPRMHVAPIAPSFQTGLSPKIGDLWISTGSRKLHFWDGKLWQQVVM